MFVESSGAGLTNGVNDVVVVPAPRSDLRRVVALFTIFNSDTAVATPRLFFRKNGVKYPLKQWPGLAALADGHYPDRGALVLKAIDEDIVLNLLAAITANQLTWTAHWGDSS